MKLHINDTHTFDFIRRSYIMGVLNTTPDSFSDGGSYVTVKSAIERALEMAAQGVDIIDIGGESSRPGAEPVALKEEIRRTIPIIKELRHQLSVPISIDTCKAEVAAMALDAGASIVNDISAMTFDPLMAPLCAQKNATVVLMHIKGTPRNMQKNPVYKALMPEIAGFLRESIWRAVDAGVREDKIILDPGIGFGKTFDHNLEILNRLNELRGFGKPVLVGASRKAFIGSILGGQPANERLEGSLAAHVASVLNGANIIRTHDVKETVLALRVADSIIRQSAVTSSL